jgi:hypothetical protein
MNIFIIFGIAAGCILAERLWPAMGLPRVNAWWGRVILINSIQLGITMLAGQTWNRWLDHMSIFHLKDHFSDWVSALIIYVFSTFIYYGGIDIATNRSFSGARCTRPITPPVGWKSSPAFTNTHWKSGSIPS